MSRWLIVLLVFAPLVAALLYFQGWRDDDEDPSPRVVRGLDDDGEDEGGPAFAGTGGRGTFFVRFEETEIEGAPHRYPAAYFHFGVWSGRESAFDVEDVLVVWNAAPKSVEDLQALLVISTDESPEERLRRLREASAELSSISARRGVFSGDSLIERSDSIDLAGSVKARIVGDGARDALFEAGEMALRFSNRRLRSLRVAGAFEVRGPALAARGSGLRADAADGSLKIEALERVAFPGGEEAPPRLEVSCDGPFTFDQGDEDAEDLFDALRLDTGTFSAEGGVRAVSGDLVFESREFSGLLRRRRLPDGSAGERVFENLRADGKVSLNDAEGSLAGERARIRLSDAGVEEVVVEGQGIRLVWGIDAARPERGPGLVAEAGREARMVAREGGYDVEFLDEVELRPGRTVFENLRLTGDRLLVELRRVRSLEADAAVGDTRLAFRRAVLDGSFAGSGTGLELEGSGATLLRRRDVGGRPVGDDVIVAGPASLRQRFGGEGERGSFALRARGEIQVKRSASPFAASEASARDAAVVSWRDAAGVGYDLEAREIAAWLSPAAAAEGPRRLESLTAHGMVVGTGTLGHRIEGESLLVVRGGLTATLEGTPASILFAEGPRRQRASAQRFEILEDEGTIVAEGGVEAALRLPALWPSATRIRAREAARRERRAAPDEDLDWVLSCSRLEAHSVGSLLGLSTDAPADARLRDIRAQGRVTLSNPDRSLQADDLFLDRVSRTGWASGSPVSLAAREEYAGSIVTDRAEAERVRIQKDWTLLEGRCDVTFHLLTRDTVDGRSRPTPQMERFRVRCDRDVLVKPDVVFFSGRTVFERGEVENGGLRIESDTASAHMTPAEGSGRPGELRRIRALGDVGFRWQDLVGSGGEMDFVVDEKTLYLGAGEKRDDCVMTLRGQPMRSRNLAYDLEKKRVRIVRPRGEFRSEGGGR